MIANKYKYLFIDSSYVARKSQAVAANIKSMNGGNILELTPGDIVTQFIYCIKKMTVEYGVSSDKIILLADCWDPEYNGYYRTFLLNGAYKDDRTWITEKDLDKEGLSDEERYRLEIEAHKNKCFQEAKKIIRNELGKIGMPTVLRKSFEADDLSYIYSSLAFNCNKPSCSASKDMDWMWLSVNPKVDFFRIPANKSLPEFFTYSKMIENIPEDLRSKISLYQWRYLYDSIEGSHNAMRKTRKDRKKTEDIIRKIILYEDYSDLEDYDTFQRQYSSSYIERYPGFDSVVKSFHLIDKMGTLGDISSLKEIREKYNINISDRYYTNNFLTRLDERLYSE